MSLNTLRNIIRKTVFHADGNCMIAFQGGEPSLAGLEFFQKAVDYAKYYNRKGLSIQFGFQTNGTLITKEWCEFFKENHFLVGISVDGTQELHDRYRRFCSQAPTWEQIVTNIKQMERFGVEYNILTVVHRETAQNIRKIYHFYKKMGWDFQQYITCLDPLYEEPGHHRYSLTPELYGQFLIELFDCWYEDYQEGCQPFNRQFENYVQNLSGYLPESCEHRGLCGIQYVVEADGSVYPCDFYMLDEFLLGNINTDTFATLDKRRIEIGFLEKSRKISDNCKECTWKKICRSGCMRCRIETAPDQYQNYFCKSYQMFFEHCYPRLKKVAENCMQ